MGKHTKKRKASKSKAKAKVNGAAVKARKRPGPPRGTIHGKESAVPLSPRDGPNFTVRFSSAAAKSKVKAAARKAGLSLNTWLKEVAEKAAATGAGATA